LRKIEAGASVTPTLHLLFRRRDNPPIVGVEYPKKKQLLSTVETRCTDSERRDAVRYRFPHPLRVFLSLEW